MNYLVIELRLLSFIIIHFPHRKIHIPMTIPLERASDFPLPSVALNPHKLTCDL